MKKCPHCKADIEENARFCLYCMTPLEDKQALLPPKYNRKRWLVLLAAFLVLVLTAGGIWLVLGQNKPAMPDENRTTDSSASGGAVTPGGDPPVSNNTADASRENTPPDSQTNSDKTSGFTSPFVPPTAHTGSQGIPTTPGETVHTEPTTTDFSNSPTVPSSNVIYLYRQAKVGDDFIRHHPISENDIVITGVKTPSENGEYIIPAQIDGKTVIAIMGLAFCDETIKDTVKKVVVPTSVRTIRNYAFANCYHLTDIYFCGDAIYTDAHAFAQESKRKGTLTIHCSADCSDRNFRYYKNSVAGYGAVYQEWNG